MVGYLQQVHCPNCGQMAEKYQIEPDQLRRIQCGACDYLMITCIRTGKVIEAYAPGLSVISAR